MKKSETKKLVGKVLLKKGEVQEAFDFLYEEHGKIVQLWNKKRQKEEISNYWLDRGKEDMSLLNEIES